MSIVGSVGIKPTTNTTHSHQFAEEVGFDTSESLFYLLHITKIRPRRHYKRMRVVIRTSI